MDSSKRSQLMVLMLAVAAAAGGCGGGGGDAPAPAPSPSPSLGPSPSPSPAPAPSTSSLQGVWEGSVVSGARTLTASALMRPDGRTWLAITDTQGTADTADDTTRLVHATFAVDGSNFAATGQDYVLGSTTVRSIALATTTVQGGTSLAGTLTGTASETVSLNYQSRYDTAAVLSDFANSWRSSVGAGAVTVNWSVSAAGAISGTSTTGCTYSGQITLRTEAKAIADATLTETCPAATTAYSGAATYNASTARTTLALTTATNTSALLLRWER